MASRSRLGRGLSGLVSAEPTVERSADVSSEPTGGEADAQSVNQLVELKLETIQPNSQQPRRTLSEDRLDELAASIAESGVMQPVVVREMKSGGYELVAGERRWRAAKRAGLETVPAIVKEVSEDELGTLALVENVQREDLNPIDRAYAMRALSEKHGLTHQELASRLGLSRPAVSNSIRLTELEQKIRDLLASRALSAGHAKVLLGLEAGSARVQLAANAVEQGFSVRELERRVEALHRESEKKSTKKDTDRERNLQEQQRMTAIASVERRIEESLGTRVKVKTSGGGTRGVLEIKFMNLEHFDSLLERLGVTPE